jgi:ribonuclease HI
MTVSNRPVVSILGKWDGSVYPTQGETLVPRGDSNLPLASYEVEVDADSSYARDSGIRAISWQLSDRGRLKARRTWGDRSGEGPNHTELLAALHGLHAARLYEARTVHLRIDNKLATGIITGLWTAKKPSIKALANRVPFVIGGFETFAITWVRTREIKRVDADAKRIRTRHQSSGERRLIEWEAEGARAESIKWRTGWNAHVGFY